MDNPRFSLIVMGLFFLGLGYTTLYNPLLQSLPTHGPLVALSFIGALFSFLAYGIIRALNFLGRTIRENDTLTDMLKESNGILVWLFICYLAMTNYKITKKIRRGGR